MIYGYIRVSTDKQTVENQRPSRDNSAQIKVSPFFNFFNSVPNCLFSISFVPETVSSTHLSIIIFSFLQKLLISNRSLLMIMSILHECMKNEIQVWTIKDNFRLGKDIQSQVLAFAFGLSAQIERDLISMRTKEALARKKAEGVKLGRPLGRKSAKTKLTGQEQAIQALLDKKIPYSGIARILNVHRLTVSTYVKNHGDSFKVFRTNAKLPQK